MTARFSSIPELRAVIDRAYRKQKPRPKPGAFTIAANRLPAHPDVSASERVQVIPNSLDLLIHIASQDLRRLRLPLPRCLIDRVEVRHSRVRRDPARSQQPRPDPLRSKPLMRKL